MPVLEVEGQTPSPGASWESCLERIKLTVPRAALRGLRVRVLAMRTLGPASALPIYNSDLSCLVSHLLLNLVARLPTLIGGEPSTHRAEFVKDQALGVHSKHSWSACSGSFRKGVPTEGAEFSRAWFLRWGALLWKHRQREDMQSYAVAR